MKLGFLLLWGILTNVSLTAEEPWVLLTGPEAVESIPVNPVQPVAAQRGLYSDGADRIWLYLTQSPFFFPQGVPDTRSLAGTPWYVVGFFPASWNPAVRTAWLDRWVTAFQVLASLPPSGGLAIPAVLTKR